MPSSKTALHTNGTQKLPATHSSTDILLEYSLLATDTALPSKGKFYDTKFIYVRGLRFKEQMEITELSHSPQPYTPATYQRLYDIYSNCIRFGADSQLTFTDLLEEDFLTLCFWVVILTNPDQTYAVNYQCPHCNAENHRELVLKNGDIEYIDFTKYTTETISTDIGKLYLAPITLRDRILTFSLATDIEPYLSDALFIQRRDGEPLSIEARLDIFSNLSTADAEKVMQIVQGYKTQLSEMQTECKDCKRVVAVAPAVDIIRGLP